MTDDGLGELRAALAAMLPEGVGAAICDPQAVLPDTLCPQEAAAVARAVPRRRREFAAGRAAARRAMAACGLPPAAIPMGEDRAPVWPPGVTGSISHCRTACVAVVARAADVPGLGIDIEEETPLDEDLWEEICRPEERVWLADQPEAARGCLAKGLFGAKEAVYKAIYPLAGPGLAFQDVAVTAEDDGLAVRMCNDWATLTPPALCQSRASGFVLSVVIRPRQKGGGSGRSNQ